MKKKTSAKTGRAKTTPKQNGSISWQGASKGKAQIMGSLFSTDIPWEASQEGLPPSNQLGHPVVGE
jgi:hypothetical protein